MVFYELRIGITFLLLLIFQAGFGQVRLRGTVTGRDQRAGSFATIFLAANGNNLAVTADSSGRFTFETLSPKTYQLSVYSIGYEEYNEEISLSRDTTITIVLKPKSQVMQGVTVTGNRSIFSRKADRLIFDVANSVGTAGGNGLETLRYIPGVKINNDQIVLSGRGEMAVTINGRLLHLSGEALTRYLSSFPAGQISEVEVITHASASNEAAGSGGIINIITKKSNEQGLNGSVDASLLRSLFTNPPFYGVKNYGYGSGDVNLNYNKGKWSSYGSIGYTHGRQLEGYMIDVRFPERRWNMKDTGDFKHYAVNLILGSDYQINEKSSIGFQYLFEKSVYDGADHAKGITYNPSGAADSTLKTFADYYPVAYSNSANLHYQHKLNERGASLTLNGDYFNYYRTDLSNFTNDSYDGLGKLNPDNTVRYLDSNKQNINIYTLKADFDIPTSFARWKAGGKINFIDIYSNIFYYKKLDNGLELDKNFSDEFQYNENTQALYFSGAKVINKWSVEAGIRAEMTQTKGNSLFTGSVVKQDYFKIFPSLLVLLKADKTNRFSLTYDKRINRPTFWDLNPYKSLMTPYTYVEGNPYLQPEYTTHIALSHECKHLLNTSLWVNFINNGFAKVTHAFIDSNLIYTRPLNFIQSGSFGVSETVSASPFWWLETSTMANAYYTDANSRLSYINGVEGWGLYVSTNNSIAFNRSKTVVGEINFWCQFPEIDHFSKSNTYYNLDAGIKVIAMDKRLTLALTGHDLLQSSGSVLYSTVAGLRESYTNFQVFSNIKIAATFSFGTGKNRKEVHTGNEEERKRAG